MNRELTNRLRYVIEELLPPALRDSPLFRRTAQLVWGHQVDRFARFRERAPFLSAVEYRDFYRDYPHIHSETDNSEASLARISADAVGTSLLDVGCGSGVLLRRIARERPEIGRLAGIDLGASALAGGDGIDYRDGAIEAIDVADGAFDTVVCTHVLEHILDIRAAIGELRRVASRRLILVVPREREGRYTFNPHFHFFPYRHSFLRVMHPVPDGYACMDIGRDIYYREDRG